MLTDSTTGLDVVKDNGNWYAFVLTPRKIVRVDLGTNIANSTPTATNILLSNYAYYLSWAHQITMVKFNGEWLAFVLNRYADYVGFSTIVRFDFGSSITNIPNNNGPSDFPGYISASNSFLNGSTSFSLMRKNNKYEMIIVNKYSSQGLKKGTLARIDFGTDLKSTNNSAPTHPNISVVNISNPQISGEGVLYKPRAVTLLATRDTTIALITNEKTGNLTQISWEDGSLSSPMTATDLGNLGIPNSPISFSSAFWYGNKLCIIGTSGYNWDWERASGGGPNPQYNRDTGRGDSSLVLLDNVVTLPPNSEVDYINDGYTQMLGTAGTYDINLLGNMGRPAGTAPFGKKTEAVNASAILIRQFDTFLVATGPKLDVYEWRHDGVTIPGAVTDTLTGLVDSGVYTVIGSKAGCSAFSTIRYYAAPLAVAALGDGAAVKVYPNPSTGVFNITATGVASDKATVNCYNMIGSLVQTVPVTITNGNMKASVNLAGLPAGVYQLRIQSANGTYAKQIVLE